MNRLKQLLRSFFSRSTSPAVGEFYGSVLLLCNIQFTNGLNLFEKNDFGECLTVSSFGIWVVFFIYVVIAISIAFIRALTKKRKVENKKEEQSYKARQGSGYWVIFYELIVLALKINPLAMLFMFFIRSEKSPFTIFHYQTAGIFAAFTAILIQILFLKLSDFLRRFSLATIA